MGMFVGFGLSKIPVPDLFLVMELCNHRSIVCITETLAALINELADH